MDPMENLIWHYLKQHLLPKEVAAGLLACHKESAHKPEQDPKTSVECTFLERPPIALLKGSVRIGESQTPLCFLSELKNPSQIALGLSKERKHWLYEKIAELSTPFNPDPFLSYFQDGIYFPTLDQSISKDIAGDLSLLSTLSFSWSYLFEVVLESLETIKATFSHGKIHILLYAHDGGEECLQIEEQKSDAKALEHLLLLSQNLLGPNFTLELLQCNPYPLTPFSLIEQAIAKLDPAAADMAPDIVFVAGSFAQLLPVERSKSPNGSPNGAPLGEGAIALALSTASFCEQSNLEPLAYFRMQKSKTSSFLSSNDPLFTNKDPIELVSSAEEEENVHLLFKNYPQIELRSLRSFGIHLPLPLQGLLTCLKLSYELALLQEALLEEKEDPLQIKGAVDSFNGSSAERFALGYDAHTFSIHTIQFFLLPRSQKHHLTQEPTPFLLSAPSASEMKSLLIELCRWYDLGFWKTVPLKQIACLLGQKCGQDADRKAILVSSWEQFQEGILALLQEETSLFAPGPLARDRSYQDHYSSCPKGLFTSLKKLAERFLQGDSIDGKLLFGELSYIPKEYLAIQREKIKASITYTFSLNTPALGLGKNKTDFQESTEPRKEASLVSTLKGLFERVLEAQNLNAESNFFNAGGSRNRACILADEIQHQYGRFLTVASIYSNPTPKLLAKAMEESSSLYSEAEGRKLKIPALFSQIRLWILDALLQKSNPFILEELLELRGHFDVSKLKTALYHLAKRHPILSARFEQEQGSLFFTLDPHFEFPLEVIDLKQELAHLGSLERQHEVLLHINRLSQRSLSLATGMLLEAILIQVDAESSYCLLRLHEILVDRYSVDLILTELRDLYQDIGSQKNPISSFLDYCNAHAQQLHQEQLLKDKAFWKEELKGPLPVTEINIDLPRPSLFTFNGKRQNLSLPDHIYEKCTSSAVRLGVPVETLLLSSIFALLYRYTHQKDLLIGIPVMGARSVDSFANTIGPLASVVAMRLELMDECTLTKLVALVDTKYKTCLKHPSMPFAELIETLSIERDPSRSPLFNLQASFLWRKLTRLQVQGLEIERKEIFPSSNRCDLELDFLFKEGLLQLSCGYCSDLFTPALIQIVLDNWLHLLEQMLDHPNLELSKIGLRHESIAIGSTMQNTQRCHPLLALEKFAESDPWKPAVVHGENTLTYKELSTLSGQLSHFLTHILSKKKGEMIGLLMDPHPQSFVALFGVLKSHCAFVPFDPKAPFRRWLEQIQTGKITTLLTLSVHQPKATQLLHISPMLKEVIYLDTLDQIELTEPAGSLMQYALWDQMAIEALGDPIAAGGFISSKDGKPYSIEEMKEFEFNTLLKLRPLLDPESTLVEIGCGTGFTAICLAPFVKRVIAIDFSKEQLKIAEEKALHLGIHNIEWVLLPGHELPKLDLKGVDGVIFNGCVHCFSGYHYLEKMISVSIQCLSDKGWIYLGDLLDLDRKQQMLECLSAELKKSTHHMGRTKLRWEDELFVSKSYLEDLKQRWSSLQEVQFSSKIGALQNELSSYRFDALLLFDKSLSALHNIKVRRKKQEYDLQILSIQPCDKDLPLPAQSDLAYVLFTSGSSGDPKAVAVEHGQFENYLSWACTQYGAHSQLRFACFTKLVYDLTITSIFCPIIKGSTVRVLSGSFEECANALIEWDDCDTIKMTPSHLQIWLEYGLFPRNLTTFILGGEALASRLVQELQARFPHADIYNEYGPTEATVGCTVYRCQSPSELGIEPIGSPIPHTVIELVDPKGAIVPVGSIGEIIIHGDSVARGYLQNKEGEENYFFPSSHDKFKRSYATGDLAKMLPNRQILYLGRKDRQVKLRGVRVDLCEIENAILSHPLVETAVIKSFFGKGRMSLASFYTSNSPMDLDELHKYLLSFLPEFVIPTYWQQVDKLPLAPSGKIDFDRLPEIKPNRPYRSLLQISPNEKCLIDHIAEMLGLNPQEITPEEDFFELGGDSLLAMQLLSKIHMDGFYLELKDFFKIRTIQNLAKLMRKVTPSTEMCRQNHFCVLSQGTCTEGTSTSAPSTSAQGSSL